MHNQDLISNRCFNEINIGDSASIKKRLTQKDINLFAVMSGDVNPAHMDEDYAKDSMFHEVIAHGLWGGSLISTVLGTILPGPGTIYLSQSLQFKHPVRLGDILEVSVTVREKFEKNNRVIFDCVCINQDNVTVIEGEAEVIAPIEKIERPRVELPNVRFSGHGKLHELFNACDELEPLATAVVHPCSDYALRGAVEAAEAGLIVPTLIGPIKKILNIAEECDINLSDYPLIDVEHSHLAAQTAVELAREGNAEILMKGSLDMDELMHAVLDKEKGIRTERRMSHVYAFDVPTYPRPLFVTDAAINLDPDIDQMRDIIQNAIDLAHALHIEKPKVAILSAVETIKREIESTMKAAALCKMADRQQITGGILDGPLAFDNAVSRQANETKGLVSEVAGQADIVVAPNLETANMLSKQLIYLADAMGAGVIMGARLPIVITSPTDSVIQRMASTSLALLYAYHQRKLRI